MSAVPTRTMQGSLAERASHAESIYHQLTDGWSRPSRIGELINSAARAYPGGKSPDRLRAHMAEFAVQQALRVHAPDMARQDRRFARRGPAVNRKVQEDNNG